MPVDSLTQEHQQRYGQFTTGPATTQSADFHLNIRVRRRVGHPKAPMPTQAGAATGI